MEKIVMQPIEEGVEEGADEPVADKPGNTPDNSESPLLNAIEARVLGTLMEKQLTTPDAYPMTVNSLINACNQKTSRDPVSHYQEGDVVRTLRQLETRGFIKYQMGARSDRYAQNLTGSLGFSKAQQAVLCVMMLRGPQTLSELQTRTQRMGDFSDREEFILSLQRLTQGDDPSVRLFPHQSGRREDRYGHLLCGVPDISTEPVSRSGTMAGAGQTTKAESATTNREIQELRAELTTLKHELKALYMLTGHSLPSDDPPSDI